MQPIDLSSYTAERKQWIKRRGLVCVYAIAQSSAGPTKVGYAADIVKRLVALQNGNWVKLNVYSICWCAGLPVAERVERESHAFLPRRMFGEWFDVGAEDAASVVKSTAIMLYPSLHFSTHDEMMMSMGRKNVDNSEPVRSTGRVDRMCQIT